jgi:hypothetical protein
LRSLLLSVCMRKILPTTGRCTFCYLQPFNHASRFVLAH